MSQNTSPPSGVSRRAFLKIGGGAGIGAAFAVALLRGPFRGARAAIQLPDPDVATLPGACFGPLTEEERIVAAMVDTVVPGRQSDPTGAPGALDTCALNLIYDEFWPFVDYLPVLLPLLDDTSRNRFEVGFADATLEQRTEVLRTVEGAVPFVRLAYRFVRSTFYAGMYNFEGTNYLGWAGPNLGYRDHEEFSFREPVSEELTTDGNLP